LSERKEVGLRTREVPGVCLNRRTQAHSGLRPWSAQSGAASWYWAKQAVAERLRALVRVLEASAWPEAIGTEGSVRCCACTEGVRRQGRWARCLVQSRAWSKSCREVCCGVLMWCRARAHDRGGSRYTAVQWLVARSGRRGRHRLGVAWVLRCTNSSGGSPGEGASYSGYGMLAGLVCGTERMSGARGGRSLVWSGLDWKDG
jgi:hypothetical protein